MSTPLTDSINALTQYANEVTGKQDATLSDAVGSLVEGYGHGGISLLDYATTFSNLFNGVNNLPQKIELNGANLKNDNVLSNLVYHAYETGHNQNTPSIEIIIHMPSNTAVKTSFHRGFFQAYGVKQVAIYGDLSQITMYTGMFDYDSRIEKIDMEFNFSSCTNKSSVNFFTSGINNVLTSLRFAPNTLAYDLTITGLRALDADSLVSLANCLRADVTGQTLTLYSTQLSLCSSTMGNNDNGTFIADPNGTLTLADFITTVKGWTLS